jgi:histidyl-tRNA synthetase
VLVRGLDYYTRTTFEFVGPEEGQASTLCGGGRYDGLVEEIGGPPTPAIGFGAGVDRLMLALENENLEPEPRELDVFFVVDGAARERVLATMAKLRHARVRCDTDYAGRSVKGQLTQARRVGARTIVIARADAAAVRRSGEAEQVVGFDDLVATLSGR